MLHTEQEDERRRETSAGGGAASSAALTQQDGGQAAGLRCVDRCTREDDARERAATPDEATRESVGASGASSLDGPWRPTAVVARPADQAAAYCESCDASWPVQQDISTYDGCDSSRRGTSRRPTRCVCAGYAHLCGVQVAAVKRARAENDDLAFALSTADDVFCGGGGGGDDEPTGRETHAETPPTDDIQLADRLARGMLSDILPPRSKRLRSDLSTVCDQISSLLSTGMLAIATEPPPPRIRRRIVRRRSARAIVPSVARGFGAEIHSDCFLPALVSRAGCVADADDGPAYRERIEARRIAKIAYGVDISDDTSIAGLFGLTSDGDGARMASTRDRIDAITAALHHRDLRLETPSRSLPSDVDGVPRQKSPPSDGDCDREDARVAEASPRCAAPRRSPARETVSWRSLLRKGALALGFCADPNRT